MRFQPCISHIHRLLNFFLQDPFHPVCDYKNADSSCTLSLSSEHKTLFPSHIISDSDIILLRSVLKNLQHLVSSSLTSHIKFPLIFCLFFGRIRYGIIRVQVYYLALQDIFFLTFFLHIFSDIFDTTDCKCMQFVHLLLITLNSDFFPFCSPFLTD